MSSYKLTYFNVTGIGEPVRFLLSFGGVKFEDNRLQFEQWPQFKPKTPMGQVPILEIDGKPYHQTRAFSRYLAKKFNLYGSNDLESIQIDACVDDAEDWRSVVVKSFPEEDPTYKAKLKAQAHEKTPFFLEKFEERVKKNGGYFVNNKLTWADIHFAGITDICASMLEKDYLQDYPALKKLNETVRSLPKIKAYLDKRPKTVM